MKMKVWRPIAAVALSAALLPAFAAEEAATVKPATLNVRGQATLGSEVVVQLKQGETVTVLEEIAVEKPKAGEPAKWAKIRLPANTPVWISAAHIDEAGKTVLPRRLNLRAGPGENFSVLGRLERGDAVKEIRRVNGWMEIAAPAAAAAFVAAEFLEKKPAAEVAAAPPKPVEPAAPAAPTAPAAPIATVETVKADPAPATGGTAALPAAPAAPKAEAAPAAPVMSEGPAANTVLKPCPCDDEAPLPKRIVTREGVVRRTVSVHEPTPFELQEAATGKRLNYLFTGNTDINLKPLLGKRILVTGEEALDSRWITPMVKVESFESLEAPALAPKAEVKKTEPKP